MKKGQQHFDAEALIDQVLAQPVGLRVVTNHAHGFKRLLYKQMRQQPGRKVRVLAAPDSATAFLLLPFSYQMPTQEQQA
jgi:hypothetical protein